MKITAIHATEHKGSTYNIAKLFINEIPHEEVKEIFLPKEFGEFCLGCGNCFSKSEELCPHHLKVKPICDAMESSDLIILTSPVYVYHASAQMKAFLDHLGYIWMVHRPRQPMFKKKALVISTAAGAGMKSTNKDMIDSLNFWGVGKIFSYGKGVAAISWSDVNQSLKDKIYKDVRHLSKKIIRSSTRPRFKTKILFYIMRLMRKKVKFGPVDREYWESKGWLEKVRPWKG